MQELEKAFCCVPLQGLGFGVADGKDLGTLTFKFQVFSS